MKTGSINSGSRFITPVVQYDPLFLACDWFKSCVFSWEAGYIQQRAAGPPGSYPCPPLFLYFLPVIESNHVTWLACSLEKQETNNNELLDPQVLVLVPLYFPYFLPEIGSNHVTLLACLVEKQDTNNNELLDPLVLALVPLYLFISCLLLDQIMSRDWRV